MVIRQTLWAGLALMLLVSWLAMDSLVMGSSPSGAFYGAAPSLQPGDCWAPPDDYSHQWVSGVELNTRTLAMLDHAQTVYQSTRGVLNFRQALTQGSYNAGGVAASFGTHDGGGALDLSVRSPVDWEVMTGEIEPMIHALRVAGFAAWLRDTDDLYPGSPIHIHAIAVGDQDLSEAARAQIDGRFGYLRGYNGLPTMTGAPIPDAHGGPVICPWLAEQGWLDMRGWPNPYPTPGGTTIPQASIP